MFLSKRDKYFFVLFKNKIFVEQELLLGTQSFWKKFCPKTLATVFLSRSKQRILWTDCFYLDNIFQVSSGRRHEIGMAGRRDILRTILLTFRRTKSVKRHSIIARDTAVWFIASNISRTRSAHEKKKQKHKKHKNKKRKLRNQSPFIRVHNV